MASIFIAIPASILAGIGYALARKQRLDLSHATALSHVIYYIAGPVAVCLMIVCVARFPDQTISADAQDAAVVYLLCLAALFGGVFATAAMKLRRSASESAMIALPPALRRNRCSGLSHRFF